MTLKKKLTSNVFVGEPGMDLASLRSVAQTYPREFVQRTQALIDKGELRWSDVHDLRSMFNALCDVPVDIKPGFATEL